MKFINKLKIYGNNVLYRIEGIGGMDDIYGYNLNNVLSLLRSDIFNGLDFYYNEHYIKLQIINLDNININIPYIESINKQKDCIDLAKYAYIRTILLASDLSEIYAEYFSVNGINYIFDYNILYGNFKAKVNSKYKSDYYKNDFDMSGMVELKKYDIIINKDIDSNLNRESSDVFMCINGSIYDNNGELLMEYYDKDSFIPSSKLKLKRGE